MPTLDLDWELGVFRGLRALGRAVWGWTGAGAGPARGPGALELGAAAGRLELLARWSAGAPVRVRPGDGVGGWRGLDLLLPPLLDLGWDAEAHAGLYALRAVLGGATVAAERAGEAGPAAGRLERELRAVAAGLARCRAELPRFEAAWAEALARLPPAADGSALERELRAFGAGDAGAHARLMAQLAALPPGAPLPAAGWLWGRRFDALDDPALAPAPPGAEAAAAPRPTTEAEAPPVEDLRRVTLDPRGDEKTLQHSFEKVDTADSWEGNPLRADGADELEDELEALEEVKLGDLIRGGPPTHALLRADLGGGAGVPDVDDVAPGEVGLRYPEWDQRSLRYLDGWCTVYPTAVGLGRPGLAAQVLQAEGPRVRRLVGRLRALREARQWQNRQRDGDLPDIDALVARAGDRRAGHEGDDRVYLRARPRRRDVATAVLLDVSLSADAWVGRTRVLDATRAAALVLAEAADQLGDRLELLAFASHTRHRCRVWTLKGADEPWARCRPRLFALDPQGATRIGPALRHATARLLATPADRRLLLLVGDGKPTDHDRYEGPHGLADVRRAVGEARSRGVQVHAVSVDPGSASTLPQMMGAGAWHAEPDPDRLAEALAEVYGRLVAAAG